MVEQKQPGAAKLSLLRHHLMAYHGIVGFDVTATEESCAILHEHDHHPRLGASHALDDLSTKARKIRPASPRA